MSALLIWVGIGFIGFGLYTVLRKNTPDWAKSIPKDILSEKSKRIIRRGKHGDIIFGIFGILIGLYLLINGFLYPSQILWIS